MEEKFCLSIERVYIICIQNKLLFLDLKFREICLGGGEISSTPFSLFFGIIAFRKKRLGKKKKGWGDRVGELRVPWV